MLYLANSVINQIHSESLHCIVVLYYTVNSRKQTSHKMAITSFPTIPTIPTNPTIYKLNYFRFNWSYFKILKGNNLKGILFSTKISLFLQKLFLVFYYWVNMFCDETLDIILIYTINREFYLTCPKYICICIYICIYTHIGTPFFYIW